MFCVQERQRNAGLGLRDGGRESEGVAAASWILCGIYPWAGKGRREELMTWWLAEEEGPVEGDVVTSGESSVCLGGSYCGYDGDQGAGAGARMRGLDGSRRGAGGTGALLGAAVSEIKLLEWGILESSVLAVCMMLFLIFLGSVLVYCFFFCRVPW